MAFRELVCLDLDLTLARLVTVSFAFTIEKTHWIGPALSVLSAHCLLQTLIPSVPATFAT